MNGEWKWLFRAVDKQGRTVDFLLTYRRNTKAARRFLAKALKVMRNWAPVSITTDKLGSYPKALRRLKRESALKEKTPFGTGRRSASTTGSSLIMVPQTADPSHHGLPVDEAAYARIKGFEVMRMIRRRHCVLIEPSVTGEVRFVNKLFDLAA